MWPMIIAELLVLRWMIRHVWHLLFGAVLMFVLAVIITWVLLVAQTLGLWPPHH